ncbi:hypothetical protein TRVL_08769 [Trypanosoma vivax]|nr:hypothetical protein TRVL_08769 [Trypanosoma vivax]
MERRTTDWACGGWEGRGPYIVAGAPAREVWCCERASQTQRTVCCELAAGPWYGHFHMSHSTNIRADRISISNLAEQLHVHRQRSTQRGGARVLWHTVPSLSSIRRIRENHARRQCRCLRPRRL